jgi:hypothetical protein
METFRGRKLVIPKSRNWAINDITDNYSLNQRLSCRFGNERAPIEVWKEHPEWSLHELSKNVKRCNLYPFEVGMKVLKIFKPKRWLDPTAGWGDRLRCAIAYGCEYVGVDSNKEMKPAYEGIIRDFAKKPEKYKIKIGKFQTAKITGTFDLVFTSPPFFTKELYEHMEDWEDITDFLEEFLHPLLIKSNKHLEKGGHLVLYIEDKNIPEFIDAMKLFVRVEIPELKYEGAFYYQGVEPRPYYVWVKT